METEPVLAPGLWLPQGMERCNLSAVMLPWPQWYQVWSLASQILSLHFKKLYQSTTAI